MKSQQSWYPLWKDMAYGFWMFSLSLQVKHRRSVIESLRGHKIIALPFSLKCQQTMMKAYSGTVLWDASTDSEQTRWWQKVFMNLCCLCFTDSTLFHTGISCQLSQQPKSKMSLLWTIDKWAFMFDVGYSSTLSYRLTDPSHRSGG